jgi:hypothetical protein
VQQQWRLDQLSLPSLSTPQARGRLSQVVQAWFVFTSLAVSFPATQTLFAKEAAFSVDRAWNATARAPADAQLPAADPPYATPSGFVPAAREGALLLSTWAGGRGEPTRSAIATPAGVVRPRHGRSGE